MPLCRGAVYGLHIQSVPARCVEAGEEASARSGYPLRPVCCTSWVTTSPGLCRSWCCMAGHSGAWPHAVRVIYHDKSYSTSLQTTATTIDRIQYHPMAGCFEARLLRALWTSGKFCCASSVQCGLSVRDGLGQEGNRQLWGGRSCDVQRLAGMSTDSKTPRRRPGRFHMPETAQNSSSLTFSTASRAESAGAAALPSASPASSGRLCWLFRPSSGLGCWYSS